MKFLVLILVFIASTCFSQKITIQGHLADSVGNRLTGGTVMLLSPLDSSLVNFTTSDKEGYFRLSNIARAKYLLKITYLGFKTYSKNIDPLVGQAIVDIGAVPMTESRTRLDEVVVQEIIPVVIKKDTIEYNATTFKTARNANVEDLLKKLPGIEVDNDGNIKAQGEDVKRVTVDGKDFFGGSDPKLATKNLPADAIDKVQVHDRKSDQNLFSGIDDGLREKSINLELKPEKRNAAFGSFAASLGTSDRYQAKANINRFSKGKQFSVLAMGNNTNDQGFSMEEYMNFTGGAQQMMAGGRAGVRIQINSDNQNSVPLNFGNRANGVMRNYAGGVNFARAVSSKSEITGSYFYNHLDHDKIQLTDRENFLENSKYYYHDDSREHNSNDNHRVNVVLDHKIDSVNSIKLTTSITYNESIADKRSENQNTDQTGTLLNSNKSHSNSSGSTINVNSSALFRHKFGKKGRTFSTNLQFGISDTDREGYVNSAFSSQGETEEQLVNQRNEQRNKNISTGVTASYTEPLGNRKYLEVNYSIRQNKNEVKRPVFDLHNDEAILNDSLSNAYSSDYIYHRAGMNFKMNRKRYTVTVGGGIQNTHLQGDLKVAGIMIDRNYLRFMPIGRFNFDFSNTRHLEFDYETSVQEPTIQQLQPVLDNRDQLNPYQGNPNLSPAYEQSWRVQFMTFDPGTLVNFFAFADVDLIDNAITNSIVNEQFVRTTTPVNVSGNSRINTNATFGFPVNKLNSRFSVTAQWRIEKGINLLDGEAFHISQQTSGGNVRYNYRFKEIFDLSTGVQLNYSKAKYEFDQPDQAYFNTTYTAESILSFWKHYQFTSGLEYLIYQNKSTGFHQSIPLVNLAVSRSFLKNGSGEIKISVINLLDKALGINQSSSVNYIERVVTNSLGRYFLITFTYAINKQMNPMAGRRGPMMRVVH